MKTSMWKKSVRNTVIIGLVLANLVIWPFLYSEIFGGSTEAESVGKENNPDATNIVDEGDDSENSTGEQKEIFKIINIE